MLLITCDHSVFKEMTKFYTSFLKKKFETIVTQDHSKMMTIEQMRSTLNSFKIVKYV